MQYTDYVYITVVYVYILNPSYKKGKKMTILDITKKEKYILKNGMVIWVLKSKTFYSLLFILPPSFMCYLQEYFVPISGAYSIIIYIKRNQAK